WREGMSHHGPEDLLHDLGSPPCYAKANVLLSADFRYLGDSGTAEYKASLPLVRDAVEELGRGHRVNHDESLHAQLRVLKRRVWKSNPEGVVGKSTSPPRRGACHRSRSCGIVVDREFKR